MPATNTGLVPERTLSRLSDDARSAFSYALKRSGSVFLPPKWADGIAELASAGLFFVEEDSADEIRGKIPKEIREATNPEFALSPYPFAIQYRREDGAWKSLSSSFSTREEAERARARFAEKSKLNRSYRIFDRDNLADVEAFAVDLDIRAEKNPDEYARAAFFALSEAVRLSPPNENGGPLSPLLIRAKARLRRPLSRGPKPRA